MVYTVLLINPLLYPYRVDNIKQTYKHGYIYIYIYKVSKIYMYYNTSAGRLLVLVGIIGHVVSVSVKYEYNSSILFLDIVLIIKTKGHLAHG